MTDIGPDVTTINYTKFVGETSESKDPGVIRFRVNTNKLNLGTADSLAIDEFNFEIDPETFRKPPSGQGMMILTLDFFDTTGGAWEDDLTYPSWYTQPEILSTVEEVAEEVDDKVGSKRSIKPEETPSKKKRKEACPCERLNAQSLHGATLVCPNKQGNASTRTPETIVELDGKHYVRIDMTEEEVAQLKRLLYSNDPGFFNVDLFPLQPLSILYGGLLAQQFLSMKYDWQKFLNSLAETDRTKTFLDARVALLAEGGYYDTLDYGFLETYPMVVVIDGNGGKFGIRLSNQENGAQFWNSTGTKAGDMNTALNALTKEDFLPESLEPKAVGAEPWDTPMFQCRFVPYMSESLAEYLFPDSFLEPRNVINDGDVGETYEFKMGGWDPTTNFVLTAYGYERYFECFDSTTVEAQKALPWVWGGVAKTSFITEFNYHVDEEDYPDETVPPVDEDFRLLQVRVTNPLIRGSFTNARSPPPPGEGNELPAPIEIYLNLEKDGVDDNIEIQYNPDKLTWSSLGNHKLRKNQALEYSVKLITATGKIYSLKANDERNFMNIRFLLANMK